MVPPFGGNTGNYSVVSYTEPYVFFEFFNSKTLIML